MRIAFSLLLLSLISLVSVSTASAHCQVPCGIYNDHARIDAMQEDATTIEKATLKIAELSGKTDAQSQNQLARWIQTKEEHASRIIDVVATYFLTQKIKKANPDDKNAWNEYLSKLMACHTVMRAAMATKQRVNPEAVAKLKAAISQLGNHYPAP